MLLSHDLIDFINLGKLTKIKAMAAVFSKVYSLAVVIVND